MSYIEHDRFLLTARLIIILLICVFGLLGNLFTIFLILVLKEYKKSVTHWYILNLALADSIFLLTLPFNASERLNEAWIYPEWVCKAKETILFLNYYASIFFLMVMSVDRYIAVCHPFLRRVQALRRLSSAGVCTLIIWIVSLLLCIPVMMYTFKNGFEPYCKCSYIFPGEKKLTEPCSSQAPNISTSGDEPCDDFNERKETEHCIKPKDLDLPPLSGSGDDDLYEDLPFIDYSKRRVDLDGISRGCHYIHAGRWWHAFLSFNFAAMFCLPLIVMAVCYGLIIYKFSQSQVRVESTSSTSSFSLTNGSESAKRKRKTTRSGKDRKRVTIMCATLVSTFVICWLPYHAIHLAKIFKIPGTNPEVCERLPILGSALAFLNSALNPYLYSFLGSNFSRKWRMLKQSRGFRRLSARGGNSGSFSHFRFRDNRKRKSSIKVETTINGEGLEKNSHIESKSLVEAELLSKEAPIKTFGEKVDRKNEKNE